MLDTSANLAYTQSVFLIDTALEIEVQQGLELFFHHQHYCWSGNRRQGMNCIYFNSYNLYIRSQY